MTNEKAPKRRGLVYVLSGPSGVGKTTLAGCLADLVNPEGCKVEVRQTVSYTTRPPRPDETPDLDYHFLSVQEFQKMVEADEFIEFAEVYGHFYGTPKKEILRLTEAGNDAIRVVDVRGHALLRTELAKMIQEGEPIGGMVSIFIEPPSTEELRRRLEERGTPPEEMETRLSQAEAEKAQAKEFDYTICNEGNISRVAFCLAQLILSEQAKTLK